MIDFDIHLKIVGGGESDYIAELQKRALNKNVSQRIEWVGELHGDIKFQYLAEADIFILPSFNENFALVVTESLSAGTPVLISEYVGLANYVKENDLGWLCDTDAQSIADTIQFAANQKDKIDFIRKKAPSIIQRDFSPKALSTRYIAQYERLITNG